MALPSKINTFVRKERPLIPPKPHSLRSGRINGPSLTQTQSVPKGALDRQTDGHGIDYSPEVATEASSSHSNSELFTPQEDGEQYSTNEPTPSGITSTSSTSQDKLHSVGAGDYRFQHPRPRTENKSSNVNEAAPTLPHRQLELPDPPIFSGFSDTSADASNFVRHLQLKLAYDAHRFPTAQDQLAYAVSFLRHNALAVFFPYLMPDKRIALDGIEDFIHIINDCFVMKTEKQIEALKSVIESLQQRLEELTPEEPWTIVKPEIRYDTWSSFKRVFDWETTYAVQVLISKPKFYWQNHKSEYGSALRRLLRAEASSQPLVDSSKELSESIAKGQREMPERIRINSPDIIHILRGGPG